MKLPLRRRHTRRRGERQFGPIAYLKRFSHELAALVLMGATLWGGFTYFASAADVEKKFTEITKQIDRTDLMQSRDRYEDELFRLRQEPNNAKNRALIERFQNKLDDANARLRDLQNSRLRDLENRR